MIFYPKFSILIPVHNEERHIAECITSVLQQDYHNFELIIVDNGSTDLTYSIASLYASQDSRVKLLRTDYPGKNNAFNIGYNLSNGHVICLLGGDDLLPFDSLSKRFNFIVKSYESRVDKTLEFADFLLSKPTAYFFKLFIFSSNPKVKSKIVPSFPRVAARCGGVLTLSRYAADFIFPLPLNLPNEDTYAILASSYLTTIYESKDIVMCYRFHSGNSINRKSFLDVRNSLALRSKAYDHFLAKHMAELSAKQIKEISTHISLNRYIYSGKIIAIIVLAFRVPPSVLFRSLIYSNRRLYYSALRLGLLSR